MHLSKAIEWRQYDDAFNAETLRSDGQSHSMRAAARRLGISEWLLCRWQQQTAAELGNEELARAPEVAALHAVLDCGQERFHQSLDHLPP